MIDRADDFPVIRQCELLDVCRSSIYYRPVPLSAKDMQLMRQIDEIHLAYLKAYGSMAEVKKGLGAYFAFYNERRWHQNFDRKTPAMVYFSTLPQKQAAA